MNTVETLQRIRKRIEKRENWCTGLMAEDANGNQVPYDSGAAVAWCLHGALYFEADERHQPEVEHYFDYAEADLVAMGWPYPNSYTPYPEGHGWPQGHIRFNDNNSDGHEGVLRLIDRAIELAKAEQPQERLVT